MVYGTTTEYHSYEVNSNLGGKSCMRGPALFVLLVTINYSLAMKLVLQRVRSASVKVDSKLVASIGNGVLALVGLREGDSMEDIQYCAKKLCSTKLWENESEKRWRKSVKQLNYEVLVVSQVQLEEC